MCPVYLEIMRPANCLMAGIASAIGLLVADPTPPLVALILVSFTVFLITGAGNAINDYFDREIDAVNRPARPIPSGRMAPGTARSWSFVLFALGCVLAAMLNGPCLAVAAISSAVLYLYARTLKGTVLLGNVCVSYLTGSTFLFGGLASGGIGPAGVLALLAGLATMGREIAKDIEDMVGDSRGGARTLPIVVGGRPSALLGSALILAALILSYMPALGRVYMAVVTLANVAFAFSILRLLKGDANGAQRSIKVGMAVALLAFLAGALA